MRLSELLKEVLCNGFVFKDDDELLSMLMQEAKYRKRVAALCQMEDIEHFDVQKKRGILKERTLVPVVLQIASFKKYLELGISNLLLLNIVLPTGL